MSNIQQKQSSHIEVTGSTEGEILFNLFNQRLHMERKNPTLIINWHVIDISGNFESGYKGIQKYNF